MNGRREQIDAALRAGDRRDMDVAREFGVSRQYISQRRDALGLPGMRQRRSLQRGDIRDRVLELASTDKSHAEIAEEVGCAARYVAFVRQRAVFSGRASGRSIIEATEADRMAEPLPEGPEPNLVDETTIRLDGAKLTVESAGGRRALLTLHERGAGASVARVDRAQLDLVIAALVTARDALPEVAP